MILYPLYNEKVDTEKVAQTEPVAEAFLQLLDQGKYAESWQSAAKLMQGKISEKEWMEKLTKARELSGEFIVRERTDASYSTEAQDSPDGEYMMLTYSSSFNKANDVSEYVTVALEGTRWKVAGYFMQQ
jgi:hypothetical protein